MSAPTNFRVEAVEQFTTRLRWTNNSGVGIPPAQIGIYRSSTSAVAGFSLIDTVDAADELYVDTGLANGTRYWYKGTDDAGATYSSPVVSVVTYVSPTPHFNGQPGMSMPSPWEGGEAFQEQLQQYQNKQQLTKTPCDVCVQNGAIVIDCSTGCQFFRVIVDQDINSISLVGCEDCPYIDMIVPPNTERAVCGWPHGCEYTSDECYEAPLSGGTTGRTAKTNGLSYGGYGPQGGGPEVLPNDGCECPASTVLSVACCGASCTLDCGQSVSVKACGGLPPYTWSVSGHGTPSSTSGKRITVTSTQSAGSGGGTGVAAFIKGYYHNGMTHFESPDSGCTYAIQNKSVYCAGCGMGKVDVYDCGFNLIESNVFGYSGYFPGTCTVIPSTSELESCNTFTCPGNAGSPFDNDCCGDMQCRCCSDGASNLFEFTYTPGAGRWSGCPTYTFSREDDNFNVFTYEAMPGYLDIRTQAQFDAGCGCTQGTTVVTVTDAANVQASLVLHG